MNYDGSLVKVLGLTVITIVRAPAMSCQQWQPTTTTNIIKNRISNNKSDIRYLMRIINTRKVIGKNIN
jgi:hypothetical protein